LDLPAFCSVPGYVEDWTDQVSYNRKNLQSLFFSLVSVDSKKNTFRLFVRWSNILGSVPAVVLENLLSSFFLWLADCTQTSFRHFVRGYYILGKVVGMWT